MSQTFNDFFELSFFPQGGDAPLVTLKKQELGERVWIILDFLKSTQCKKYAYSHLILN